MVQAENLEKGQKLKVNLKEVKDRLPRILIKHLTLHPFGKLIGYKMVDGNRFGLVLELSNGSTSWFFENELSESTENDQRIPKNRK